MSDHRDIVASDELDTYLSNLIDAAVSHDRVRVDDAREDLKHFLRRVLSTTEAA